MTRATIWERRLLDKLPPCDPTWSSAHVAAWLDAFGRVLDVMERRPRYRIVEVEPPY
jgi:hypothetical protein